LLAEYIAADPQVGRTALIDHVLAKVTPAGLTPTAGHLLISQLPIGEVWTSNYDQLLELASPGAQLVINDDDVRFIGSTARTIVKMHGSASGGPPPSWASEPVITRSDYETYPEQRPRTWALLRAAYLSRTFLFLGFSFTDPNIEILLRLARKHGTSVGNRHLAVLKPPDPTKPDALRLHRLRVNDLEKSGVAVHEIADFNELEPLLTALVRRTRPPRLFVAGSGDHSTIEPWCTQLAAVIAGNTHWQISSMAGDAGWLVARDTAQIRQAEGTYDPAALLFSFRTKDEPAPPMPKRIGTAIYTDKSREELVPSLLDDCRAMVAIGGGTRTSQEIEWALARGVAVIPLPGAGGAAHAFWESQRSDPPQLGGRHVAPGDWELLNNSNPPTAARAAYRLLEQAMYEAG
jgi:hypothetical protein